MVGLKVHVVENVESVPGDLQEVRMLLFPEAPAFRQTQVNVCIARAAAGIAPKASGPVIKDRIVIIIVSRGDVVGKARPNIDDPRRLETEPQGVDDNGIEAVPAVETRAAPVALRVVIIGRRVKEATGVVKSAGEHILSHDVQFAQLTLIAKG